MNNCILLNNDLLEYININNGDILIDSIQFLDDESILLYPFLKWAGGKRQLLNNIRNYYPFDNNNIYKYAEPFVGAGAVLFDILNNFNIKNIYISDLNKDLIETYISIRDNVQELINILYLLQFEYYNLNIENKKDYYLSRRNEFNSLKYNQSNIIRKSALMIFLNKTCFNGLYRVNKNGDFNVPFGKYENPLICDEINLRNISRELQNVNIVYGDYSESLNFIDQNTFVYFDPPYRPLDGKNNFNSYNKNNFDDNEQKRLCKFINELDNRNIKFLLSNSDPKNNNIDDNFFDELYSCYNINRIESRRSINSDSSKRGYINEILVDNFK